MQWSVTRPCPWSIVSNPNLNRLHITVSTLSPTIFQLKSGCFFPFPHVSVFRYFTLFMTSVIFNLGPSCPLVLQSVNPEWCSSETSHIRYKHDFTSQWTTLAPSLWICHICNWYLVRSSGQILPWFRHCLFSRLMSWKFSSQRTDVKGW